MPILQKLKMENLLEREEQPIDLLQMFWLCRYSNISIAWTPEFFPPSSEHGGVFLLSLSYLYDFELMPLCGHGSPWCNSLWQQIAQDADEST